MTAPAINAGKAPEVTQFLKGLFAGKPEDLHILLWTLPEKRSYWFQDVDKAIQFAESMRQRDLYFGVGLADQDYGPTHRCVSNEVAGIVGFWADLDLKSDAHLKAALPATIEEALRILPEEFPPTFVIQTGNGVHAWWLFREPLIFDSEEERRSAANLVHRWQTLLRCNAAHHGWAFDRMSDLARVLRIPERKTQRTH
jgi:putative DNA primase/helicase